METGEGIKAGNILIREFMGGEYRGGKFYKRKGGRHFNIDVKYHRSWDWLMPSWVKFVDEYHRLGKNKIYHPKRKLRSEFSDAVDKGDILKCHEILVEGITWLNSLHK